MGLCPLHHEDNPSFLVDPDKNLFYCFGCGSGDVIRFAELYHQVSFPQALSLLRQWSPVRARPFSRREESVAGFSENTLNHFTSG